MICRVIRFLFFSFSFFLFNAYADQKNGSDCADYDAYFNTINKLSEVDKLNSLINYQDKNEIQCDKLEKDISEIKNKIFSYRQGEESVSASVVFSCNSIVEDTICESRNNDWTERGFLRTDKNMQRKIDLKSNNVRIPAIVNGYSLYKVFYSWQTPLEKVDGIFPIKTLPLTLIGDEQYCRLSDGSFNTLANESVIPSTITSGDSSNRWLTIIFKGGNENFIKAVWYY